MDIDTIGKQQADDVGVVVHATEETPLNCMRSDDLNPSAADRPLSVEGGAERQQDTSAAPAVDRYVSSDEDEQPRAEPADSDYVADQEEVQDAGAMETSDRDASGGSDLSSEESDDSSMRASRQRGRQRARAVSRVRKKQRKASPIRPDNDMTRKLRSRAPADTLSSGFSSAAGARGSARAQRTRNDNDAVLNANSTGGRNQRSNELSRLLESSMHQPTGMDAGSDQDAMDERHESDYSEDDNDDNAPPGDMPVVLERPMPDEQATADLTTLHSMPEWACIIEFLFTFRHQLHLSTTFDASSLADALVRSPGPGMLAQLHLELLQGVVSHRNATEATWPRYLANRLHYEWSFFSGLQHPAPFKPMKGNEAVEYATLPIADRVHTLKALCDMRLEREDLRGLIDDCLRPPSQRQWQQQPPQQSVAGPSRSGRSNPLRGSAPAARGSSKGQQVPPPPTYKLEDFRKEPFGMDSNDNTYWLLDCWDLNQDEGMNLGTMLFRSQPPPPKHLPLKVPQPSSAMPPLTRGAAASSKPGGKAGGKKSKRSRLSSYVVPPDVMPGPWELVASTLEELEELGLKLRRSKKQPDPQLASKVLEVLVPELRNRVEEQERWRKARERTQKMLGVWGQDIIGGRSMRQRKKVNYTHDDYDLQIKAAIRAGKARRDDEYYDDSSSEGGDNSGGGSQRDRDRERDRDRPARGKSVNRSDVDATTEAGRSQENGASKGAVHSAEDANDDAINSRAGDMGTHVAENNSNCHAAAAAAAAIRAANAADGSAPPEALPDYMHAGSSCLGPDFKHELQPSMHANGQQGAAAPEMTSLAPAPAPAPAPAASAAPAAPAAPAPLQGQAHLGYYYMQGGPLGLLPNAGHGHAWQGSAPPHPRTNGWYPPAADS